MNGDLLSKASDPLVRRRNDNFLIGFRFNFLPDSAADEASKSRKPVNACNDRGINSTNTTVVVTLLIVYEVALFGLTIF